MVAAMPTTQRAESSLWVFDLDGTLLVSQGREIIEVDGMRAAVHPIIEAHVTTPKGAQSDFRYCGEEDLHGDPHELIERAALIEPVAKILRDARRDGWEVAILSARAHDAQWLSERLSRKLHLNVPIRPDLIQCVYSRTFEKEVCDGSTPERKARALEVLVQRSAATSVHFFDDVKENLDFAVGHFSKTSSLFFYPHLVDLAHSLEALRAAGVAPEDVFHPQLRDERGVAEPNALVVALKRQLSYSNLKALQRLAEINPPGLLLEDDGGLSKRGARQPPSSSSSSSGEEDETAVVAPGTVSLAAPQKRHAAQLLASLPP